MVGLGRWPNRPHRLGTQDGTSCESGGFLRPRSQKEARKCDSCESARVLNGPSGSLVTVVNPNCACHPRKKMFTSPWLNACLLDDAAFRFARAKFTFAAGP